MSNLVEIRRVIIIGDSAFEKQLIGDFLKLGANGWTAMKCEGQGEHPIMDDPFDKPNSSRIRIEVLCSDKTADAIMDRMEKPPYNLRRVIAYTDSVQASSRRKFP